MLARPGLPTFDYVRASTRDETVDLLRQHGPAVRLLMGGTDLFPRMRDGLVRPRLVVDVKHLPGAREIHYNAQAGLTVGAAVDLNALASHPDVQSYYPILAQAANSIASYQVRNRATLGGNLCNASPAADTAPAVLVLEGRIIVHGLKGEREMPATAFFVGPGKTAIEEDEFVVAIRFPAPVPNNAGTYLKLGRSKAGDLAIAGVAVHGFADGAAPQGFRFHIALASVAPVPLRAQAAEQALVDRSPGGEAFLLAASEAAEAASPIDDVRASAAYRKAMVRNLTLRGLHETWARLQAA